MAAAPCIDVALRCKDGIIRTYILDLKHISTHELEGGLKGKEKKLDRLLDKEKHLTSEQNELLNRLKGEMFYT